MKVEPKLSAKAITQLSVGAVLTVNCQTASELDSAYHNALYTRRKHPRADGAKYEVKRSVKTMTVTVSVVRTD